jgi:hypothetical protein
MHIVSDKCYNLVLVRSSEVKNEAMDDHDGHGYRMSALASRKRKQEVAKIHYSE